MTINQNMDENEIENINKFFLEIKENIGDSDLKEVLDIQKIGYGDIKHLTTPFPEAKELLSNSNSFIILVRNHKNKIIGYASVVPENIIEKYIPKNSTFNSSTNLHFADLQILETEKIGFKGVVNLINMVLTECQKKSNNFKKITMHARKTNNLSKIMQKKWNAVFNHTENNFCNSGEDFDFLYINL